MRDAGTVYVENTKSLEENTVKTKKAVYLHREIYAGLFKTA
jgi:hypothetical protein